MNKKRTGRVLRIPPCPAYDVEGTESWLTDLAADGLMLKEDGFFMGTAAFERTAPSAEVKYRLDAAPNNGGIFADNSGEPAAEAREISRDLGWEYVARRGDFHIYRSSLPGARELNTDPKVQALAIGEVRKRRRGSAASLLTAAAVYAWLLARTALIITAVNVRTWFFLLGVLLLLWLLADAVIQTVHLGRLCSSLESEGYIDHNKSWRRTALRHRISVLLSVVLTAAWVCILLSRWGVSVSGEDKIPLDRFTGEAPFATIADFAPEGEYSPESIFGMGNTVTEWSDWLAPVNIRWDEIARVSLPDGSVLSGYFYADYHDMISPELARLTAREYVRADCRRGKCGTLDVPIPEADYAAMYISDIHAATAVLSIGNRVIHASFLQYDSGYNIAPELWAGIIADSLRSGAPQA